MHACHAFGRHGPRLTQYLIGSLLTFFEKPLLFLPGEQHILDGLFINLGGSIHRGQLFFETVGMGVGREGVDLLLNLIKIIQDGLHQLRGIGGLGLEIGDADGIPQVGYVTGKRFFFKTLRQLGLIGATFDFLAEVVILFLHIALDIVGKIFGGHVHGGADLLDFFHLGDGVIQQALVAGKQGLQTGHPLLQFHQVGRVRGQILGLLEGFLGLGQTPAPCFQKSILR